MTFTGRHVFPLEVRPEDVDLRDIAHALALQCRYNGHVNDFYSVAEHCVHVSAAILTMTGDRVKAMQGLLHDAPEAYTGDFIRPVKNSLKSVWDGWKNVEINNEKAIFERFDVPLPLDPIVKQCDYRIIANEKEALFGVNKPWDWQFEPLDVIIRKWDWHHAEGNYLRQFAELATGQNREEGLVHYHNWLSETA